MEQGKVIHFLPYQNISAISENSLFWYYKRGGLLPPPWTNSQWYYKILFYLFLAISFMHFFMSFLSNSCFDSVIVLHLQVFFIYISETLNISRHTLMRSKFTAVTQCLSHSYCIVLPIYLTLSFYPSSLSLSGVLANV